MILWHFFVVVLSFRVVKILVHVTCVKRLFGIDFIMGVNEGN